MRDRHGQRGGLGQDPVQAWVFQEEADAIGPEGYSALKGERGRGEQLAPGPGQDRARPAVGRPAVEHARRDRHLGGRIAGCPGGCEDEPACRPGTGTDPLREPLRVVLHEPDGRRDHRRRAAVVHLEVHPAKAGQRRREAQDAPHVREPPAVDGLVVVTHQEDPVVRCREQECQAELARVHVLDLVDEKVRAPRPPALEERRVRLQPSERERDEVVEVDAARRRQRRLVGEERPRDRSGPPGRARRRRRPRRGPA